MKTDQKLENAKISLHICLVTPFIPRATGNWGGVHTHADMFIRLLLKNGYEISVIAPDQPHEAGETGYHLVLLDLENRDFLTPRWFAELEKAFECIARENRPDFIFSEGYYAMGIEKVSHDIPIFAFVHNFHLVQFYKLFSEINSPRTLLSYLFKSVPLLLFKMFKYEIPFLRKSSKTISVSELNARLLTRFYRLPPEKVSVLHNWVDTEVFRPIPEARASARRKLHLTEDQTVFLLVGALWRPKGFHVAIEAFKRLADKRPETVLLLTGAGPYKESLKVTAGAEILASGRIRFLGEWRHEDLPLLYNLADIFIIPSIHPEGLAYTLIEAMASGLPSIATSLGGNIETIGDAGFLVPPRSAEKLSMAMLRLAADSALRDRLAELARKRSLELFSEELATKKVSLLLGR